MNDARDREVFELTPERRAEATAEFEASMAFMTDPVLEAECRANFARTMAMTWQERRDRMTADETWRDVIVE